jgi:predicted N-acetyltransferase YhbS
MFTEPGITISPATLADIPALLEIKRAAFEYDQFHHLMMMGKDPEARRKLLKKSTEESIESPGNAVLKATDKTTGEILGWAIWNFANYDVVKPRQELITQSHEGSAGPEALHADGLASALSIAPSDHSQPTQAAAPQKTPAQLLAARMGKATGEWYADWLGGKKHMALAGVSTSPKHQGRGIGSALVRWGTVKADEDGVPCWIHASPAALGMYLKTGFKVVGSTDYDLEEAAPGGKGGNRGWGIYTFRYMLRLPENGNR